MIGRRKWLVAGMLILAAAPVSVLGNAGTPLIWVGMAHLAVGNAVIGWLEGVLLSRWFKAPLGRCQWTMVAANYVSMWIGAWFLGGAGNRFYYFDLESARGWLWAMVAAAFLITLVVELPFVFFAIGRTEKRVRKTLGGNLAAQAISYLALFGIYFQVGSVSALTQLKLTPLAEMDAPENVMVYCVPSGLERVSVGSLADGSFIEVETLPHVGKIDRLAVEKTNAHWNLLGVDRDRETWPLMTNMSGRAVETVPLRSSHMNFGLPTESPGAETNDWKFFLGFWEANSVRAENKRTGERRWFALETPFGGWKARNATVLPDGKLLFQFGKDQICLLDAERKRIALVVRGRGPVAVIQDGVNADD